MTVALIRDVLDLLVVDRDGEPIGRVNGMVMTWDPNAPPRVAYLELGGVTLARRLPPPFRSAMLWLARRLSARTRDPYRVPVERIVHIGRHIEVDLDATRSPARATEHWVRDHIIGRIPGS